MINRAEMQVLLGRALTDAGAVHSAVSIVLGHRLGLYAALAEAPATASSLAARTGTDPRYAREWLLNQAAAGYVSREGGTYSMTPAQREFFTTGAGIDLPAALDLALAVAQRIDEIESAFRSGGGVPFERYGLRSVEAMDRFASAAYRNQLLTSWLPALEGMVARLSAGARVADIGCGSGGAVRLMAAAYPRSTFEGFDNDPATVAAARSGARPANLAFFEADATKLSGRFDLVTSFELLHDAARPEQIAAAVARCLVDDGLWLVVEPRLVSTDDELMNLYGRFVTGLSLAHCIPVARAAGGVGHGMSMKRQALLDMLTEAGLRVRDLDSPMATVLEARLSP